MSSLATAALPAAPRGRAAGSPFDRPLVLALLAMAGLYGLYPPHDLLAVVRDLTVPDTDDAMRLVEVRDLLAGQSWFDLVQHRHGPPAGVSSHWSRFVDLPIAALILGLRPLVGARLAEGLTVALWPAAVFALYATCLFRAMRARFGVRAACLGLFACGQTGAVMALVSFGRIDHHNVQIAAAFASGLCLMQGARPAWAGALAGTLSAFALAVGLESLPFVAAAGLFVAGDWVIAGAPARRFFAAFGLALGIAAGIFFLAQTDPRLWSTTACDALSPPWLWLSGLGASAAVGAAVAGDRLSSPGRRAALLALVGGVGVAGFALLFPSCLGSPFASLPEIVRTQWLDQVMEAQSFAARLRDAPSGALGFVVPVWIALGVALVLAGRGAPEHRRTFAVVAAFLAPGSLLALVQLRGVYVCAGFVPLVAGIVLDRALGALRTPTLPAWRRAAFLALAFAMLGRAWFFAIELPRAAFAGDAVAAERVSEEAGAACRGRAALAPLDALPAGTVLAPIDLGPALLLHTHHSIVAAPYHRGVAGLTAGLEAFGGDEAAMRRHAQASGASYVVACPKHPERPLDTRTSFAQRLADGEASAAWLEPLALQGTAIRAWRVTGAGSPGSR